MQKGKKIQLQAMGLAESLKQDFVILLSKISEHKTKSFLNIITYVELLVSLNGIAWRAKRCNGRHVSMQQTIIVLQRRGLSILCNFKGNMGKTPDYSNDMLGRYL